MIVQIHDETPTTKIMEKFDIRFPFVDDFKWGDIESTIYERTILSETSNINCFNLIILR